jgi:Skp family chaperone for outer membrane proteins
MKSLERVVFYILAIALLATQLPAWLTQQPAFAEPWSPVQSQTATEITLLPEGDGDPLVLRNREGRLSWGAQPQHHAYSIGFVHIGDVLRKLMDAEVYREEMENLQVELREREEEWNERMRAFRDEFADVTPEDENADAVAQQWRQLQSERDQWQRGSMQRMGEMASDQLERAYRDLTAAVGVVADRRNIDVVHRFIPPEDEFEATNPDQALLAIRLRSVLHYPESLDITADVLEELSLEVD